MGFMSSISKYIQRISDKMAERIRSLRIEKGISNNELSQLSGLSRAAIRKIERSDRNPTINTLLAIADAFNIPCWQIIKDAEDAAMHDYEEDSPDWALPEETENLLIAIRKKCKNDPDYAIILTRALNLEPVRETYYSPSGKKIEFLEASGSLRPPYKSKRKNR